MFNQIHVLAMSALLVFGLPAMAQDLGERTNPNTATEADLRGMGGTPDDLVNAILANRPFDGTAEFDALVSKHIDGAEKSALYESLFLPIDLNKATSAEIALIPGMSRRMIHEFEEYRPYDNIEQFNREIGKYVDGDEVARLRSYVSLSD